MTSRIPFPRTPFFAAAIFAGALASQGHAQDTWEHFTCYNIDPHGGFKEVPVELKDQFASYRALVIRPVMLCNPVDKNGEGIKDPDRHLVCYQIRADPAGGVPPAYDVNTSNQFTEQSMTAVLPPRTLCVPSKKEIR